MFLRLFFVCKFEFSHVELAKETYLVKQSLRRCYAPRISCFLLLPSHAYHCEETHEENRKSAIITVVSNATVKQRSFKYVYWLANGWSLTEINWLSKKTPTPRVTLQCKFGNKYVLIPNMKFSSSRNCIVCSGTESGCNCSGQGKYVKVSLWLYRILFLKLLLPEFK